MINTNVVKQVAASLGWGFTNHLPTRFWMERHGLTSFKDYSALMKQRGFPAKDTVAREVEELWCADMEA
jgi:hypothetical protein